MKRKRIISSIMLLSMLLLVLFASDTAMAGDEDEDIDVGGDWVSIVSLTPNHYDNYSDPVTFTATINYQLTSKDQGIIYLGFNTSKPHYYDVDVQEGDHQVVSKGIGTVTLTQTVTPVNWNSGYSYMQQFLDGNSVAVKDFKVYANISEYPHDIPWTPLAIDEAIVTEVPEYGQTSDIQYLEEKNLRTENVNMSLEKAVFELNTDEYSPELAHLLITLCNSIHDKDAMERTFGNMGFSDFDTDYDLNDPWLAYGIAKKELSDGTFLVLVVTRGTDSFKEFASNLDSVILNSKNRHGGFDDAAQGLRKKLNSFLRTDDYSQMRFILTGHSRGAAATNLLAADLLDSGVSRERLTAYNFACPDVEIMKNDKALSYTSIFNIGNVNDTVSWIPGAILWDYNWDDETNWNKYGQSYWYAENWDDKSCIKQKVPRVFRTQDEVAMAPFTDTDTEEDTLDVRLANEHSQVRYLEYLRNEYTLDHYKNRKETDKVIEEARDVLEELFYAITMFCPVDIAVYDADDKKIAYTQNDLAQVEDGFEDKVFIAMMNDKKRVFINEMDAYKIIVTGTDEGEMFFAVQEGPDYSDPAQPIKSYNHIKLTKGKMFSWVKENDADVADCMLCLVDSADTDKVIAEIQSDGSEVMVEEITEETDDAEVAKEEITDTDDDSDTFISDDEEDDWQSEPESENRKTVILYVIIAGLSVIVVIETAILIGKKRKRK